MLYNHHYYFIEGFDSTKGEISKTIILPVFFLVYLLPNDNSMLGKEVINP